MEEIDGAVLSSNTILRGVTGQDLLEELQVLVHHLTLLCFYISWSCKKVYERETK